MKRKIAIVGGGMAGLAAAFDLARTQDLRDRYDVTVYQLGWRLGGKAASSRDERNRIVEHGLHIWFGGYQNAFELVRAAFVAWGPTGVQDIKTWEQAFAAQDFTMLIGTGDQTKYCGIAWPQRDGAPVEPGPTLTFSGAIEQLLDVLARQYMGADPKPLVAAVDVPKRLVELAAEAGVNLKASASPPPFTPFTMQVEFDHGFMSTVDWAQAFRVTPELRTERQLRGFAQYLRLLAAPLWDLEIKSTAQRFLRDLIEAGTTLVKGVILDMALAGKSCADLDDGDFREWLCGLGGRREAIYGSSLVQSLYDTAFQYEDGDKRRPNFAAGTAAQVSLRLFGGYKGHFAYQTTAGLGECAIVPIYRALRKWDVKFRFFHKLTSIKLDEGGRAVAELHFDLQAKLSGAAYEPTIPPEAGKIKVEHWPNEPRWKQIDGGRPADYADFESYWYDHKVGDPVVLTRGEQFDDVVLAIPAGALKPREKDDGPCKDLIDASPRFRRMIESVAMTPTIAFQAWCTKTLADVGWPPADASPQPKRPEIPTASGPSPLNIWADRTAVMAYENHGDFLPPPKSLQYLCDVMETDLFRAKRECADAPKLAWAKARGRVKYWLTQQSAALWPGATSGQMFQWDFLFDDDGSHNGEQRLDYQIIKANIDPWACCVGSPAGSTRWRLGADGAGFEGLYLAGAWTDCGFNVECIESAVISGRQAARAITGEDCAIEGESFLRFGRGSGGLICELARGAVAALQILEQAIGARPFESVR